ncbi:hypothetical protein [Oceaniglobus roseus]|nr:hypothetical protein [Kandeliimicrobium roseum]
MCRLPCRAAALATLLLLAGCAVVTLPVKVVTTATGAAVGAVTQDAFRPR